MNLQRLSLIAVAACAVAPLLGGCGDAAPTKAPPITGKIKEWKDMAKEEKLETVKTSPMPEEARAKMRADIEAGRQ